LKLGSIFDPGRNFAYEGQRAWTRGRGVSSTSIDLRGKKVGRLEWV